MTESDREDRTLSRADELDTLVGGDVELRGRVLPASNLTFFGEVSHRGQSVRCVYKPIAGERPLWDFPDGTLASREVAAYVVSDALGWDVVPPTVLREGPLGVGMVQIWRDPDPEQAPIDIVPRGQPTPGFLHVLDAVDGNDEPVSLVHEDSEPLRRMAVFDVIVNNADRKGGHVLAMVGGHRYGVDHGVSFHVQNKLRTVLWGWADQPLHPQDVRTVADFAAAIAPTGVDSAGSEALVRLLDLLAEEEIDALGARCRALLIGGRMPLPSGDWPAIPWPAF